MLFIISLPAPIVYPGGGSGGGGGGGGSSSGSGAQVTNVVQFITTSTNLVIDLGLASTNHVVFKVGMTTNSHVVLSNALLRAYSVEIAWQQDTNGQRSILSLTSTDGFIQTNSGHRLTLTTNASALDVWWLSASFFPSNVIVDPGFNIVDLLETELGFVGFTGSGAIVRSNSPSINHVSLIGDPILWNSLSYNATTGVSGTGGANTNFAFTVAASEGATTYWYVNAGTTNVNIAGMGSVNPSFVYRGVILFTNRTATSRLLSLGANTNNWINIQKYMANAPQAPFTITNALAARMEFEMKHTNVYYRLDYCDLPAN